MDRGIEKSFMVNRVVTGDTTQKLSPDRTSIKSNSTNSSNSAIGIQDKKTPFLIGVAGGTASGKVLEYLPYFDLNMCYLKLYLRTSN